MAGLGHETHLCDIAPFTATAFLEQGVVLDRFYGLALDGILVSQTRRVWARHLNLERAGGIDLDGGLSAKNPVDWHLPLAACVPVEEPESWHWLCSTATALNQEGTTLADIPPSTHRLSVRMDARRAHEVAVRVPTTAGGASGRFRPRVTPVLNLPASAVRWTAVGCIEEVRELLDGVSSVGGRRGSGEGAVRAWDIKRVDTQVSAWHFGHSGLEGMENNRPVPAPCARVLGVSDKSVCTAGVRPPLLHPSRQREMILPTISASPS